MKQGHYLALTFAGLALVILVTSFDVMAFSKVLTGVLMGIGLSISAFSCFKLLVNDKREETKK